MRRIDPRKTNAAAVEGVIKEARKALLDAMPSRATGEWQVIVRWTNGVIDHLEPQSFGSDAPSEQTGVVGPTEREMRRIEAAIQNVTLAAVQRHPFGRLSLKIEWAGGRVTEIKHAVCQSHKVDPVSVPA